MTATASNPRGAGRPVSKQRTEVEKMIREGVSSNTLIELGYPRWLVNRVKSENKLKAAGK